MRRYLATVLLIGGTAAWVALHPPRDYAVGRGALAACPVVLDQWNGTELSFEDAVVEELRADDILVRRYQRGAEKVWLCVVYHQRRRYGAHDPKLCYESQGYFVDRVAPAAVDDGTPRGLTVNRFVADKRNERRIVYYWWSADGLHTADVGDFRRRIALRGAVGGDAWGAFVRVETVVRDGDEAAAERAVADFAATVARRLPAVLEGATGTAAP